MSAGQGKRGGGARGRAPPSEEERVGRGGVEAASSIQQRTDHVEAIRNGPVSQMSVADVGHNSLVWHPVSVVKCHTDMHIDAVVRLQHLT